MATTVIIEAIILILPKDRMLCIRGRLNEVVALSEQPRVIFLGLR